MCKSDYFNALKNKYIGLILMSIKHLLVIKILQSNFELAQLSLSSTNKKKFKPFIFLMKTDFKCSAYKAIYQVTLIFIKCSISHINRIKIQKK